MNRPAAEIFVKIIATRGSAPRDAGTVMRVTPETAQGTIGGGALEYRAVATARRMLARQAGETTQTIPLGPDLGQCCGGAVTLLFTTQPPEGGLDRFIAMPERAKIGDCPLWIWGAGHVGRAVLARARHTGRFDITWIDTHAARFPASIPQDITQLTATDMPRLARHAPQSAHHLIFTYSHDIDFELCAALLGQGTASLGLIGSATKWARFSKRLRALNLDPSPVTCPIGDKALGKHPDSIAQGVVASLLMQTQDTTCNKALA